MAKHLIDERTLEAAMGCSPAIAAEWARPLSMAARRYHINTPLRLAAWIAQMGHESASLSRLVENMNYSAAGLAKTWPSRFAERGPDGKPDPNKPNELARQLHRRPEEIANTVYANRMGNGSSSSGDGWTYRGHGPFQLTGRENHLAFWTSLGHPLGPPEALLMPPVGAMSAGWFWHSRGLNELADNEEFEAITRRINGGLIGLSDRLARYDRAKRVFKA